MRQKVCRYGHAIKYININIFVAFYSFVLARYVDV